MKINYSKILQKNMINVFKDILLSIEKNDLLSVTLHHLGAKNAKSENLKFWT